MHKKIDNKGFTVIELIVAMAIISIITSAIYLYLMTNIKCFNAGLDINNLQCNAEYTTHELCDIIMPAHNITVAKCNANNVLTNVINNPVEITHMEFLYTDGNTKTLKHNKQNNQLLINNTVISNNVKEFKAYPVTLNSFSKCNLIKLVIIFENNNSTITINKKITLRNKEVV
ncbi:MAG: prepilin-type N-terminal cleavage/methylation domain-containing protein [Vallitalea sp.]|nr:prepilin-type N-terminal cleavage/methylation domain-containing protein [Vallitalea sp.]